jgi:hypothetical protein
LDDLTFQFFGKLVAVCFIPAFLVAAKKARARFISTQSARFWNRSEKSRDLLLPSPSRSVGEHLGE